MKSNAHKMIRGIIIPTSILSAVVLGWAGWESITTINNQTNISSLTASIGDLKDSVNEVRSDIKMQVLPRLGVDPLATTTP